MYKFDIDRIDLYKVGVSEELTARTKNRLNQMANMGMEEVGFADFGIKGSISGWWAITSFILLMVGVEY